MNILHRLSSAAMAANLMLLPILTTGFRAPIEPRPEVSAITQGPQLTAPEDGTALVTFGPTLEWTNPTGTTQVHLQVTPANDDGPGVNIILGSPETSFEIPPPPDWYGLLPDMSYTWRVRATDATVSISETDSRWGPWSTRRFITPEVFSSSLNLTSPSRGGRVSGLTPVLSWTSNNPAIFYYEVEVSKDPAFGTSSFLYSALLHGGVTTPTNSYAVPASFPLAASSTYHWRVRPRVQGDGDAVAWSTVSNFTTPEAGAMTMQLSTPVDETEVSTSQYRVTGNLGGGVISLARLDESTPLVLRQAQDERGGTSRTNSKFMVMTVNQVLASIDASGRFSATVDLVEGPNVIDLIATDEAGEQVTSTFTVTYVPQDRTQGLTLAQETPTPTGTPTARERAREREEEAKEKAREEREKAEERAKEKAREEREKAKEKAKARADQERQKEGEREKKRAEVREKVREQEKPRTYAGEVTEKGTSSFSIKTRDGRTVSFQVDSRTEFKQDGRGKQKPAFAELTRGMTVKVYSRGTATVERREGPKEPAKTATPAPSPSPTGTPGRATGARLAQTPTATTSPTATATPVPTGTPAVGAPSTAPGPGLLAKKVELPRVKDKHAHRLGTITALNEEEITIKDKDGKAFSGELKPQTKRLPGGTTFGVGDRVLVAGVWDDDEEDWVIWLMVKLGQRPGSPDTATSPAPAPPATRSPTATATATLTATITATSTATATSTRTP